jgi:polyhydroxyalkanoate synthesis regulator phasin
MAYDEAQTMVERTRQLFERAEDRGVVVEADTRELVKETVQKARRQAEEVQEEVHEQLEQVKLATGEEVAALNAKVDALRRQLDVLLQKVDRVLLLEQEEALKQPLADYDQLNVREVVGRLDSLTIPQLVALRDYELAHEKRVTVLREVDARINRMPIPGYDELTVDVIEPLLPNLEDAHLIYLAGYEAQHENRVTLLRSIEREQARRLEVTG